MSTRYKYEVILDFLVHDYCAKLPVGSLLPGLEELCQQYDASEVTIKRSLSLLVENGFVKRIPGKGTIVLDSPLRHNSLKVFIPKKSLRIQTLKNWRFSDYLEKQAAIYMQENPATEIFFERYNPQELQVASSDLIAVNSWVWAAIDCRELYPLDNIEGLTFSSNDFTDGIMEVTKRKGVGYMLPLGASPMLAIYNLDRPEINKIDWQKQVSLEEFVILLQKTQGRNLPYPFFAMSMRAEIFLHFVYAYGGRLLNKTGDKCMLHQAKAQKGLKVLYEILHKYNLSPHANDYTGLWDLFNTGRFLSCWGSYGRIRRCHQKLGLAKLPQGSLTNGSFSVHGMVINKDTANLQTAKDFINFLLTPEAQLAFCKETDCLCSRKIVAEMFVEKSLSHIQNAELLLEMPENSRLIPGNKEEEFALQAINTPLQMLTLGIYSPKEFAIEAAKALQNSKEEKLA